MPQDPFSPEALAQGNTYGGALKDRLMQMAQLLKATPGAQQAQASPQLGGMAGNAQQAMQNIPYMRYVQEAQAMGQQPMTPEQFMQGQR